MSPIGLSPRSRPPSSRSVGLRSPRSRRRGRAELTVSKSPASTAGLLTVHPALFPQQDSLIAELPVSVFGSQLCVSPPQNSFHEAYGDRQLRGDTDSERETTSKGFSPALAGTDPRYPGRGRSGRVPAVVLPLLALLLPLIVTQAAGAPAYHMDQRNRIGCIWRSSISPTMPAEQVFTPRPECRFGQLWWYDPHPGYLLRIYFRYAASASDFRLCLQYHDRGHVTRIHRQNGTADALVPPPEIDADTCMTSENGLIELYFEAPSYDVHVTVIEYVIRDVDPP